MGRHVMSHASHWNQTIKNKCKSLQSPSSKGNHLFYLNTTRTYNEVLILVFISYKGCLRCLKGHVAFGLGALGCQKGLLCNGYVWKDDLDIDSHKYHIENVWLLLNFVREHGPLFWGTKILTPRNGRPYTPLVVPEVKFFFLITTYNTL